MLEESLKKFGLTDKEILVYLTVLENGKITPANIASITGIKRPTVYSVGKELIKKGVITEDLQGASGYFVALPPESLTAAIKQEEEALAEKKKLAKELMESLSNLPKSKSYSVPKMRFIDEQGIESFLYKQSPVWDVSTLQTDKPTWWGFQDHTFVENGGLQEWIKWYWKQSPEKITLKMLTNDSAIENQMREQHITRRIVKFWKKDLAFTATTWIVGDFVVLCMTRQHPHYLVEIHDAVYAENLRQVFKNLWDMIP